MYNLPVQNQEKFATSQYNFLSSLRRKFNFSLNSGFRACRRCRVRHLPDSMHVVFTFWIKSSDEKRSVLLPPKYIVKQSSNLGYTRNLFPQMVVSITDCPFNSLRKPVYCPFNSLQKPVSPAGRLPTASPPHSSAPGAGLPDIRREPGL